MDLAMTVLLSKKSRSTKVSVRSERLFFIVVAAMLCHIRFIHVSLNAYAMCVFYITIHDSVSALC